MMIDPRDHNERQTRAFQVKSFQLYFGWLIATLFIYFLIRLEFLWWNWKTWFADQPLSEIFFALLQGVRFDLASLLLLTSPLFILALIPWPHRIKPHQVPILKWFFIVLNIPFLVFNLCDVEFIHFSGRRMTPDSFYLIHEAKGKWGTLFSSYGALTLLTLVILILFIVIVTRFEFTIVPRTLNLTPEQDSKLRPFSKQRTTKHKIFFLFGTLLFFVIGSRGGFQKKPLNIVHATSLFSDIKLTQLTLNSTFTMLHSITKKRLNTINCPMSGSTPTYLNGDTPGKHVFPWTHRPKNVVLFILESFSLEYTGLDLNELPSSVHKKSYSPFLDSLMKDSLYFRQSFANGRRSIEALPSLLAGVPSLLDEPFVMSPYQTDEIPKIGVRLAQKGIWSGFFHGGDNGTMFFQEFIHRIGIQHYYGKNEYPDKHDDDGTWGIWDRPFLQYFRTELNRIKGPFFASLFTLSSHHPFRVPKGTEEKYPEGPIPILKTISYTDESLREFFNQAKHEPWFKDTLFIFTADHTSKSYLSHYQDTLGNFRIPIIMYFPGSPWNKERSAIDTNEPVQQIDIYKTIETLFELEPSPYKMGRSLLQTGPRKVTLYLDGSTVLKTKTEAFIQGDERNLSPLKPITSIPMAPSSGVSIGSSLPEEWCQHRQYYINSLLQNTINKNK